MDEGNECSKLESVEDNELTNNPSTVSSNWDADDNTVEVNGSCSDGIRDAGIGDGDGLLHDDPDKNVEIEQEGNSVSSPHLTSKSPDGGSPAMTKGYGLRKWKRRARRDVVKDGSQNLDSGKAVKRGLSGSSDPSKPMNLNPVNGRQNSEGSVGSTTATRVGVPEGFMSHEYNLESRFAIGPTFAAGTDSENSEDRGSKSSTAASAPRLRHDLPAMTGHIREKNRIKSSHSKVVCGTSLRSQQGKGQVDSIKKPRGERVKIEKETSHSSIESDSRSSKFAFVPGVYSMTSNGIQSGSSMNYDGEKSDDGHADEQEFGDEAQTSYGLENVEDSRDGLAAEAPWEEKEEKSENNPQSEDQDPLLESFLTLQTLQEALENEVKQLGEVGKDSNFPENSAFRDSGANGSSLSEKFDPELFNLKAEFKNLEKRLVEATALLEAKQLRITELETTVNTGLSSKEESWSIRETRPENSAETETELDGIFRQKIEAEIIYVALKRTIQKLIDASGDEITLLGEQKALVVEQSHMLDKLSEAEKKAATLKREAEDLEKYCEEMVITKEVMKMQKKICTTSTFFLVQLLLLLWVIYLLLLQSSPRPRYVVPT